MIEILTGPHAGKLAEIEFQSARRYSARRFFVIRDPAREEVTLALGPASGPEVVHPLPDALRGLAMIEQTYLKPPAWRYAVAALSLGLLDFVARSTRRRRYLIRFTQERAFEIATNDRAEQKMLASIDRSMPEPPHHATDKRTNPGRDHAGPPESLS